MNDYKCKLLKLVDSSKLTIDQKELWKMFLMYSNELENEAVFEAANEGDDCLILLTDNLRDKILSMKSGKNEEWSKIAESEGEYSKQLEEKDSE
jgi:hypothetical protein